MLNSTSTRRRQHSRRGAAWPLLLACLGLVMAASALAVDAALLWQARQELQVAADASALGAMLELADDQLLRQLPGGMKQATDRAAEISVILAQQHHVLGAPLRLEPFDSPEKDFTLGFMEDPALPLQPVVEDYDNPNINALMITARRTRERGTPVGLFFTRLFRLSSANVAASATAMLERRVVGFRPAGDIRIPLMPIGILSDPTALEERSWEAQIDKPLSIRAVRDQWIFDKTNQAWSTTDDAQQRGDGLPEMEVTIPLEGLLEEANGIL
jgi:dsDNA-binding SOS-regulon protein